MFSALKKLLFGQSTAHWKQVVTDPNLGELRLNEDATWWEALVPVHDTKTWSFRIGGEVEPSPALLQPAAEIIRTSAEVEARVLQFIRQEAERDANLHSKREDIARLQIASISFFWPEQPERAEIEFTGARDEEPYWRCELVGNEPAHFGFDD